MRQIPKKNYFIVLLILVATFFATQNIVDRFKEKDNLEKNMVIDEIKENEIDNYITERTEAIIYVSSFKKEEEINKKVNKYISNHNLVEKVIYLDADEISEKFESDFKNKYKKDINVNYPCVIIFSNNEVKKVVRIINKNNVKKVLDNIGELK